MQLVAIASGGLSHPEGGHSWEPCRVLMTLCLFVTGRAIILRMHLPSYTGVLIEYFQNNPSGYLPSAQILWPYPEYPRLPY